MLRQATYLAAVDLDDASAALARALSDSGYAGLQFQIEADQHVTHVAFGFGGEASYQVVSNASWQHRIATLRDALTALPADTEHGFIRPATRGALGLYNLDNVLPLPGIEEHHVRYNKHLSGRYLPDAHGIQLVRTAHLDNAHDLTAWDITDLGHDRHLVQARDLEPWYAHTQPEPDVLTQARADFAGALLTEQVITDHPTPW